MKNFHWYFFILFYSIFFIWYSNLSGPLNDEEIDSFMKVISERSGNDEQNIQRLRKFMEEDDGKDFFMVNFLDYNESPETMPATGKGASSSNLMNYYMEYMYPEMFKRASHPIFFSEVFFQLWTLCQHKAWRNGITLLSLGTEAERICWKLA